MALFLQILIGDQAVDLDTKTEGKFFITKQINDLRSLNSRNGSFTRNIMLPATTKNVEIFFKVIPGSPIIRDIWEQLKCRVLFGGVTLFFDADLFLINYSAIKRQIEVRIVGGNSVFFDQMETKTLVDANFYDIEFDWTLGNLLVQSSKTSNDFAAADQEWIVDGEVAFTKSNPLRRVRMSGAMGLFLFYREIIERLVESNGYSIDITDLFFDLLMFKDVQTSDIGSGLTRMTITTDTGIDVNSFATVGSVDLFVRGNSVGNADPLQGQFKYGEIVAINQMVGTATIDIRFDFADPTGTFSNYFPFKVSLYNQIALSIPVTQFAGGELREPVPFDTFSDLTSPQTIDTVGTTQIIGWTNIQDSPVGSWDDVAQAFIMTKDFLRGIRFTFSSPALGFLVSGTGNKFFNIEKNGNAVYSVAINNAGGVQTFAAFFPVDSGDRISFSIRLTQEADSVELVVGPHSPLNNEVTIVGSSDIGTEVSLPDYLPNISQKKMFAEICKTMNLVPEVNEFTKTVVIKRFDAIFELLDEINYNYFFGNTDDDIVQGQTPADFIYAELNIGTGGLQDWSDQLDLGREIKFFNFIPTWFRNNLFGWALGTDLKRQDTTGSYPMLNEQLRDTGDKIRSIFGAMDDSELLLKGTTSFTDRVSFDPKFIFGDATSMGETAKVNSNLDRLDVTFTVDDNPDVQPGDVLIFLGGVSETDSDPRFISAVIRDGNQVPLQIIVDIDFSALTSVNTEWSTQRIEENADSITRVCTVRRKSDVTKGFPWLGTITDGGPGGSTIIPEMVAHFSSNLTWGAIIGTEYKKMLAGLNSPLMIRAWFVFDPVEFTQIKMMRIVYVTTLNGLFYINKIEQYKVNKPVRVELIRMNSVLQAGQIVLPTGGEPLQVELEGLLTK